MDRKWKSLTVSIVVFVAVLGLMTPLCYSNNPDEGYTIYTKTSEGWELQEELQFLKQYSTASVDLRGVLPDADGEYKVRISQQGGIAAHIDYVALASDEEGVIPPVSALRLDDGSDVFKKVALQDNDVADAWGKTIELTWGGSIDSPVLLLNANEELSVVEIPMRTPQVMIPELMLPYTIENNGAFTVDGVPDDALGDADFSDYWLPASGHPWGYTYLWLRSDGEYLYAIMEVTSDNTYDETGWGCLYIYTNGALKEFRVDAASDEYGLGGFVYSNKVAWQHILYEFEIPLSELEAGVGDSIKVGYGSYGTEPAKSGDSADSAQNKKDKFSPDEDVYAIGDNFPQLANVTIYVVEDRNWSTMNPGDPIPPDVSGGPETVQVNLTGHVFTLVWPHPLTPGKYDIVFDVGDVQVEPNGQYDRWDEIDGFVGPGFTVEAKVPALSPIGLLVLVGLLSVIAALTITKRKRR
jgi:hypothetical protein